MVDLTNDRLQEALVTLGELLASRGQNFALVIVGGGGLLLQGRLTRTTEDLDVVARVEHGRYLSAEPLPEALREAAREVATLHGLHPEWLNAGPTDLLRFGLPAGFEDRTDTRHFGGVTIHLAGRLDQIAFKLYAAVDRGPRSKHFRDLQELNPTNDELVVAARWAITHDTSPEFEDQLQQALAALGFHDVDLAR